MPVFKCKFEISDELLEEFSSRFLEEVNSGPEAAAKYHPDDVKRVKEKEYFMARYLLHQDLNVENALKMLKKSLQFRQEMNVNTLKKEDLPEEYFDARTVQIYNEDKDNHPILVFRGKAHKKNSDEVRLHQQYLLYWLEKAVRSKDWGGVTVLFDCTDASYKNVDLDMIKFILTSFQHYYPWTLHLFMVYNMPWYLSALWKIVKTWIPEKHLNRLLFVDRDSILEHVDKEQLPVCMGGTCTDQYDSKIDEDTSKVRNLVKSTGALTGAPGETPVPLFLHKFITCLN